MRLRQRRQFHKETSKPLQLLINGQELFFVNQIIELDHVKQALSHAHVRKMVAKIVKLQSDDISVGICWIHRILSRHPQIKGMTAKPFDGARVESATPQKIDDLYALFDSVKRVF